MSDVASAAMTNEDATRFVISLYHHLLGREPRSEELRHWADIVVQNDDGIAVFHKFLESPEYIEKTKVRPAFPAGHYYSPVVDPRTVRDYVQQERRDTSLSGIALSLEEMTRFWQRNSATIRQTPFPERAGSDSRFHYENGFFAYGDAIALRATIADIRPKRIIEIGSGFSSACMLDSVDEFGLDTRFTFIDPYPERLRGLLRPGDIARVEIVELPVQSLSAEIVDGLGAGDMLFIDSTHVMKTGSDVHFELFHLLPALKSGVVVHFHDIHYPFEYPNDWIHNLRYSWNEIYALRAFLMYNQEFSIRFWGSYFVEKARDLVGAVSKDFLRNPGGSLWLERI